MFRTPRSFSKVSAKYLFSESISTKLHTNDYILKTSIQYNFKQIIFQKTIIQIKGSFNLGGPIRIKFKGYSAPFWWWHLSGQCQIKFGLSEKHTKLKKKNLPHVVYIYLVNVQTTRKIFFKFCVLLRKSEI